MKTLLLMRHAKSSRDDPSLPDRDRPLNKRGKEDAPRMGRLLRKEGLTPDLIVCSPATRALATAEAVAAASRYDGEIRVAPDLYPGDSPIYARVLREIPEELNRALVVGHNPAIERFLSELTGTTEVLPTAAVAVVELPLERWKEFTDLPSFSGQRSPNSNSSPGPVSGGQVSNFRECRMDKIAYVGTYVTDPIAVDETRWRRCPKKLTRGGINSSEPDFQGEPAQYSGNEHCVVNEGEAIGSTSDWADQRCQLAAGCGVISEDLRLLAGVEDAALHIDVSNERRDIARKTLKNGSVLGVQPVQDLRLLAVHPEKAVVAIPEGEDIVIGCRYRPGEGEREQRRTLRWSARWYSQGANRSDNNAYTS